ncbi:MAG TPA: YiiX/YebB-like N1pC/P60 family cysteine hydrolase [Ignavibacteriaceae bacterium]
MKKLKLLFAAVIIIYLILLIPEPHSDKIEAAQKTQFVWDRDSIWHSLEDSFVKAKQLRCAKLSNQIWKDLLHFSNTLSSIEKINNLEPDNTIFDSLLNNVFQYAPLIGACPDSSEKYINLNGKLRQIIKDKSKNWDPNEIVTRNTLYKLLYGSRAAVEEIILQADKKDIYKLSYDNDEPSATPSVTFLGVKIHSGDILLSRGGAPTSALISRGSDYPGNFSHVALVYIDPKSKTASVIEAHIEVGIAIATLEEYMKDKKLRVMVLRLRSDLPALIADPMLPHKAAQYSLQQALSQHIPYDFEMNYKNSNKLFCSEVASSEYKKFGIYLWMGKSTISSLGTAKLLAGFGVKYFETQEPSDLAYDPQLSVVAEWRDIETLYKDHVDNAVVDAILEWSDKRNEIKFDWYMLPVFRIVKLYSVILNQFEIAGPIPEGMSATSALRHEAFKSFHSDIKNVVLNKAEKFKEKNGYTPPYWRLLEFARNEL